MVEGFGRHDRRLTFRVVLYGAAARRYPAAFSRGAQVLDPKQLAHYRRYVRQLDRQKRELVFLIWILISFMILLISFYFFSHQADSAMAPRPL